MLNCDAVEIIGIVPEVMCPIIFVYDSSQPDSRFNGRYKVSGYTYQNPQYVDEERPNAPVYLCKTCIAEDIRKIYWIGNPPMSLVKGWCIGYYKPGYQSADEYCSM